MDKELDQLVKTYQGLDLSNNLDYDKFNEYAIVHHSSTIEGSTLTEVETRLLLDEGLTPKGKPLDHTLMVKDHYDALKYVLSEASIAKTQITIDFIRKINGLVMKNTGKIYETVFGQVDGSKGEFRKGNVSAGNSYFVNFNKVEILTEKLVKIINEGLLHVESFEDKINLSFDAQFDLLTIHPFYDGNGRTSRLLMNFIQRYFSLPLAIVFKEDKAEYFTALEETRLKEDIQLFRAFMIGQYKKYLLIEIEKYRQLQRRTGKGKGYSLIF